MQINLLVEVTKQEFDACVPFLTVLISFERRALNKNKEKYPKFKINGCFFTMNSFSIAIAIHVLQFLIDLIVNLLTNQPP